MSGEVTVPRLHYFPSRLPDETLHSRVSRLHTLSGNLDDRHTLQDLFGSHTLVVTSHLPSHLNALASRLPEGVYERSEDVLEQGTLFPYFRPFLQSTQVEQCRAAMCGNSAGEVKVGIGLVASRIGAHNTLRYCRQCCTADLLRYGVAYWHREHQLPGVWLCLAHAEPLVELHPSWLSSHRHNLFLPVSERFKGNLSVRVIDDEHADCLSKCARLSVEILGAEQTSLNPGVLRSFYRKCATQQGWIDTHGRILTAAVHNASAEFCRRWPFETSFQFLRNEEWVFKLLYKHRSSMHPLKHVAMLILLGTDWSSLLAYCREHSAESVSVPPSKRIYFPLDVGPPLAISRSTRPKTLKGEKLNRLCVALATATSLQKIALEYSVSLSSLYRILGREPIVAAVRNEGYREARRARFIEELQSTTPPRYTQDYMWLYRNDRDWLDRRTVRQIKSISEPGQWRVNWSERDIQFAQTVRNSATAFYERSPPIRVSKTLIARSTGKQATIEKYASRLPLTLAALEEVTESLEHFQCRRVECVARELKACGQPLLPWKILRIAGLKRPLLPALERAMTEITKD